MASMMRDESVEFLPTVLLNCWIGVSEFSRRVCFQDAALGFGLGTDSQVQPLKQ